MRNKKENLSFFFKGISGRYSGLYVVVRFSLHAGRWPDVDMVDLMWSGLFVLLSWEEHSCHEAEKHSESVGDDDDGSAGLPKLWVHFHSQLIQIQVLYWTGPIHRSGLLRATMQMIHPGLQRYNFRWGNILLSCRVKGFMFKMSSVSHT